MKYGYIYLTTNLINNKIYIGQHKSTTFDKRYKGSGKILKQAFKLYGKENFSCEILEWCETFDQLNEREIYWLKLYGLPDPKKEIGYNITAGGQGISGYIFTDQEKLKLSLERKDRIWINNGKLLKLVKKDTVDIYINNGWTFGRLNNRKKIICLETNIIYPSLKDLQQATSNSLDEKIIGKRPFRGLHYEYYDKYLLMSEDDINKYLNTTQQVLHTRKVLCLENNTIYESEHEAAKALNLSQAKICLCCQNKRKSTGKLHFRFIDEDFIDGTK